MQIQVNTDKSIEGSAGLTDYVESEISDTLGRFGNQLTRVEVHLSDVDGRKAKGDDKNCLLEARLAGRKPIVVNHQATTINAAVDGATKKLEKSLDHALGKLRGRKGRPSFSGDDSALGDDLALGSDEEATDGGE
jgi:ribosome-associated translation inhibitor RaiA